MQFAMFSNCRSQTNIYVYVVRSASCVSLIKKSNYGLNVLIKTTKTVD